MSDQTSQTIEEMEAELAEEAMNADKKPDRPFRMFGEVVTMDIYACYLETGKGKIPFDPARHPANKKSISVTIEIQNLFPVKLYKKDWLTWQKDWKSITLQSLNALGLHLSTLRGKWVCAEYVATGQKYEDKTTHEMKDSVTIKFLEVFDNRDQCEAAQRMWAGGVTDEEMDAIDEAISATEDNSPIAGLSPDPDANAQKMASAPVPAGVATQAVKALWTASGQDKQKFSAMFAKNPAVKKVYATAEEALSAIGAG